MSRTAFVVAPELIVTVRPPGFLIDAPTTSCGGLLPKSPIIILSSPIVKSSMKIEFRPSRKLTVPTCASVLLFRKAFNSSCSLALAAKSLSRCFAA